MGIVLVLIGQAFQSEVVVESSVCLVREVSNSSGFHCLASLNSSSTGSGELVPQDFTNPLLFYMALGTVVLLVMVVLFRPRYRRLEVEQRAKEIHRRLSGPEHNPSSLSSASPSSSYPHVRVSEKSSTPPGAAPMLRMTRPEQRHGNTKF